MSRRFVVGVAFLIINGSVESDEKGFFFFETEAVIDTELRVDVLDRFRSSLRPRKMDRAGE